MDEQQITSSGQTSNTKLIVVAAVIALVAFAAIGVFTYSSMKTEGETPKMAVENVPQNAMTKSAAKYNSGVFTAEGEYLSPGGPERVKVTVTISEDLVSEVEVESLAKHPTSKTKQADFIANYKPMVIGKNIDEIELTKVSGSSLTPKGFNSALEQIKGQAAS